MDLEDVRGRLAALLGDLPKGAHLAGWSLVHLEVDEALSFVFERGGDRLEVTLGPRDDDALHFAQTASFNVGYYVARLPGRPLPPDARPLLDEVLARIARHDDGAAAARFAARATEERSEIRTTQVDSLLCPSTIDGQTYYTANPYVGCTIGSRFCYAQSRISIVRRFAGAAEVPWGRYLLVKENAAAILDRELHYLPPRPVVFSPLVADAYQGYERRGRITRSCLEVLGRHGVEAYVLTRSTLVLRDRDVLARLPRATVGFSIPTDDDAVALAYEPRAARVSERFEALHRLREAGLGTVAVVQPILSMNIEALAEKLAAACDAVRVDVYRAPDVGAAPLEPERAGAPAAPSDQGAARAELLDALGRRGVRIWTSHVPP